MKHIKTYKLFENSNMELEVIDVFLRIQDMGFEVTISPNNYDSTKGIEAILTKNQFTISEIREELEICIRYIEDVLGLYVYGFGFPVNIHNFWLPYNLDRGGDGRILNIDRIDEVANKNNSNLIKLTLSILCNVKMDKIKLSEQEGRLTSLDELFS